ncbi:hypothetical protein PLEOSDRAFT_173131 [Pleurotus ostreatus PC15]|uniref:Uncharacterized protein n=1 Tax=Pleurotus ostreatus (strain PC15) TaxID=1137138 RepID=A0A067P571_PLEO1|nr:hypothetical protein PLEOSDRAFT_173131 [Pleurotus ostreatus PC15]
MPKATRPSLPTSLTDFALPASSSTALASPSPLDDIPPLLQRFRRPSLLSTKGGYFSDGRLHSPLASSFTLHPPTRRRLNQNAMQEDGESDKERMLTDSSPSSSSENTTPPLGGPEGSEGETRHPRKKLKHPATPPRKSSTGTETQDFPARNHHRRLSFPVKQPRILRIRAESRPLESEVQSEAAFQRLVASCSELPTQPRTPRNAHDRGRYPEEAGHEEDTQHEPESDDEDEGEDPTFTFVPRGSEPININKPFTPSGSVAGSIAGSINGDDISICGSPGTVAMDIDIPMASPSFTNTSQWRYTPPPTSSAVRSNKRKFSVDDRFDPYPSSAKRRAVSPSMSHLREHGNIGSPLSTRPSTRLPIAIPISIPASTVSSAASSPTIAGSFASSYPRPMSITSSPTLRATMGLASPILRPFPRSKPLEGDEREIEGAGEAVGGLTLS